MKVKYLLLGALAVAVLITACNKPQETPAPTSEPADKATTEQVAKEAEAAANSQEPKPDAAADTKEAEAQKTDDANKAKEGVEGNKDGDKAQEAGKTDDKAQNDTPAEELKAEDKVSEDQKY